MKFPEVLVLHNSGLYERKAPQTIPAAGISVKNYRKFCSIPGGHGKTVKFKDGITIILIKNRRNEIWLINWQIRPLWDWRASA
jgi:hypothetical protein